MVGHTPLGRMIFLNTIVNKMSLKIYLCTQVSVIITISLVSPWFSIGFQFVSRVVENGVKTVERKEDGKLISRLVNGEETLAIESEPRQKQQWSWS